MCWSPLIVLENLTALSGGKREGKVSVSVTKHQLKNESQRGSAKNCRSSNGHLRLAQKESYKNNKCVQPCTKANFPVHYN